MANLHFILTDKSEAPSHPVGFLTSENRDVWSYLREELLSAGMEASLCTNYVSINQSNGTFFIVAKEIRSKAGSTNVQTTERLPEQKSFR